jgi:hypothetical protein
MGEGVFYMGRVDTLTEIVERLTEFDSNDTIYASEPWTEHSYGIVAPEPASGGLPAEAVEGGMKYFLEISIAKDFTQGWIEFSKENPSSLEICRRLIQYAINDA